MFKYVQFLSKVISTILLDNNTITLTTQYDGTIVFLVYIKLCTSTWSIKPASVNLSRIECVTAGLPIEFIDRKSYNSSRASRHSLTEPLFETPDTVT